MWFLGVKTRFFERILEKIKGVLGYELRTSFCQRSLVFRKVFVKIFTKRC
jgi:hypothetical protein